MISWMIIQTHIWNRDSYSVTDLEKLYIIISKQWFSVIVIKVLQRVAILLTKNKSPEFRSFVDNLWGSSEITPTWVNLQKYKLNTKIQSKMLNPFFSCDLRLFLFSTNWLKVRKRFPPSAVSFYTLGGCLFIFLNTDTKTLWNFFKREFNKFWLRLVKETKNVRFFWEETWTYD